MAQKLDPTPTQMVTPALCTRSRIDRWHALCMVRRLAAIALLMMVAAALLPAHTAHAQEAATADTTLYLPAISGFRQDCAALKQRTMFGVQTYGSTGEGSQYYQPLIDSGASWVRVEIYWSEVEPQNVTPDRYNWTALDRYARGAADGCLNLVFTHESNPAWAATHASGPLDKTTPAELAQYLAAVVERYDGDRINDAPGSPEIHYFEIYNEPDGGDLPGVFRWGEHGAAYADMLRSVYPAMKAASPKAQILLGGIAYDNFIGEEPEGGFVKSFFTDLLDAGGGAYFDIMNFHYYPLFAGRWTGKSDGTKGIGLVEKTAALRAVLAEYGLTKPVAVTEGGWHSNADQPPFSSEDTQVKYLFQIFMQSFAANLDFTMWWTLYDIVHNSYPYQNGLVSSIEEIDPPRRKPSFNAYKTLTTHIAPLTFVRKLPDAVTGSYLVETYEFNNPATNRKVYAGWLNPMTATSTRSLTVTAVQVVERDVDWGEVKTLRDADDGRTDGKVRLTITSTPRYFEVTQ